MDYAEEALKKHKELKGKISVKLKDNLDTKDKLSTYYTPGVAAVSSYVAEHPQEARDYTWLNNNVAVISDGSAVLGLGNIGPYGALPVMEGKALLFKEKAGIDAWPIVLDTQDPDEIVRVVKAIAPAFGGINLEDIAAPNCFNIEKRLSEELDIPVMHDDQHGTAIVVLAGLINAAKVVKKDVKKLKIVISGAGAAGTAVAKLLMAAGVKDIILLDRTGVLYRGRPKQSDEKAALAMVTNPRMVKGGLHEALSGADVLIGVSGPGLATAADVRLMGERAIVFAMANPIPEIMP